MHILTDIEGTISAEPLVGTNRRFYDVLLKRSMMPTV
jgi:hypothetical protein